MIEDTLKKDKVIAITSYCDTQEKITVLLENIRLIRKRFPEFKIALHANYALDHIIQKMVDYYYYEDLNHTEQNKWIYYWTHATNPKTNQPYFEKKFFYSILDTGFSVFQQIRSLSRYLIEYEWVMLINYDTSVEEIRMEDYSMVYDLVLHYFPGHKAVSLIIMSFNPQIFYNKVAKYFTYKNWIDEKRNRQLNEERFFDMINESDIHYFAHDYKVSDKISNEPDFLKPNAPKNEFFGSYLLYIENGILEIYLWDILKDIYTISFVIDGEYGYSYVVANKNDVGAFEHMALIHKDDSQINKINIYNINDTSVDIDLYIKKGYSARFM